MTDNLNPKHRRFVQEFIIDLNATEAAKRSGYSEKAAHVTGCRLLKDAKISSEIAKAQQKIGAKLDITAEKVLKELALIGFANMQDYMRAGSDGDPYLDFSALTREQAAALAEVTVEDFKEGRGEGVRDVRKVKFKLSDKRAALVDIGKHLGMFKDKVEMSGPEGRPIPIQRIEHVIVDPKPKN